MLYLEESFEGEVAEWLKASDCYSDVRFTMYRGFESHPLLLEISKLSRNHKNKKEVLYYH